MKAKLPKEVQNIIKTLEKDGHEAYAVGGCVRDSLIDKKPKDWDITTSAEPKNIQKLFPQSVYENDFGTVAIKTDSKEESLKIIEATTYRTETKYTDKRHPDKVKFSKKLEDDLKRRDFTINALAMDHSGNIIDLFHGKKDLKEGVIKTVGSPNERFGEDALRMMRAVRFAAQLNFTIEDATFAAIKQSAKDIKLIAKQRIRDELTRMFETKNAAEGILFMKDSGLLDIVLPEVAKGIGVEQNKHHIYDVFEHNWRALKWADEHDYPLHVKFAALLHDVAKPQTKRGKGADSTFYGHDVVGGHVTAKLLERLHFSKKFIEKVSLLVRHHLFYYEVEEVTESSVRRLVAHVGPENMDDLILVRICDRMGSGVPKPEPYRLRHFQYMVEKVQRDPISVKMLKVSGNDIIKGLGLKKGGPQVGKILAILLDEVLDDPKLNTKKYLLDKVKELSGHLDKDLDKLYDKAVQKQKHVEKKELEQIKKKYHVK